MNSRVLFGAAIATLLGCSSSSDTGGGGGGQTTSPTNDAGASSTATPRADAATTPGNMPPQSMVCQSLAYNCADCRADCGYIPITTGCASEACPSSAQFCRTAENPAGYCTHVCSTDADCPIEGGGVGTCTQVNTLKICVVQ